MTPGQTQKAINQFMAKPMNMTYRTSKGIRVQQSLQHPDLWIIVNPDNTWFSIHASKEQILLTYSPC